MRTLAVAMLLAAATAAQDARPLIARMGAARDKVFPCIVHIQNVSQEFAGGERTRNVGSGSGFLIDAEGHIVTNHHVAEKAHLLHVTLSNKRRVKAQFLASDPYSDLALLKVDPKEAFPDGGLRFASFGTSAGLKEGDFVMAMGSPLSLSRSISFGIISCRERVLGTLSVSGHETGKYNTWLQTDAAINPGNSGGPLVNLEGEIIGVNTRASFMANNIGFAIPVDIVKEIVAELLKHRTVPRSFLGLTLQPLGALENTALGSVHEGALIAAVADNSPAKKAGVQPGDFVTKLNGEPFVAQFEEQLPGLYRRISKLSLSKEAFLSLVRGGKPVEIRATPTALGRHLGSEHEVKAWGITVRAITEKMRRQLQLADTKGVRVTGVRRGAAASGRLFSGDIIRSVQGIPVDDLPAFMSAAAESVRRKDALIRLTLNPADAAVLDVTALRPSYEER